jgi:hypothetical protein
MARTGTRRPVLGVVVGTRRIRDRAFLIADGVPMWGRGFPPTGFGVPAAVPLIIPSLLIGEARQAGGVIRNLLGAAGVRRRDGHDGATGLAKCAEITAPEQMPAGLLRTSLRFLTWCCAAYLRRASVTARAALARGRGDGAAPARPRALADILQRFLDQQDTERGPVSDVVASGSK